VPVKSLFKWLLIGLAALLLAAVVLIVAIVTLVDPKQYQALVIDQVRERTGRELLLEGPVALDLLPCCGVRIDKATLGNPPGFSTHPFLRFDSARLGLRLWPLLTRRTVEIGSVTVGGLQANLLAQKDGSNNWSFGDEEVARPDATSETDEIAEFSITSIELKNATLSYTDEADGSRYRIEELDVRTGPIHGDAPVDLRASLVATDLNDNTRGKLKVSGPLVLAKTGAVMAKDLDTEIEVYTSALPDDGMQAKLRLKDLAFDPDSSTGTVGALTGTTTVAGISLDIDGRGSFGKATSLSGTLRIPAFSPRELLTRLKQEPPDTADSEVLKKVSGNSEWFYEDQAAGLRKLDLTLDDTGISGDVSRELLSRESRRTPRTRFDLHIDQLNLDRYLAPESEGGKGDASPVAGDSKGVASPLRDLNLEGRLRIGQLGFDGLKLSDTDISINAEKGKIRLEPLSSRLYGGESQGRIRLDASGDLLRMEIRQKLVNVDMGALLADFADVENLGGTMNFTLEGSSTGNSGDALMQNLAADLSFAMDKGVYRGMDVWYEIRRAHAALKRTAAPVRTGAEETPVDSLQLTGKLRNGILNTDTLSAQIPFLRVSGKAAVAVQAKTLTSELEALVYEKPVFGDDTSLAELENVRIPFTVTGPVADPKVRVDLGKMVKGAATETIKDTVRKKLFDKFGIGTAPEETPAPDSDTPADSAQAAPAPEKKDDPLKKALDRLLKN
jgi:AsmA protein